MVRFLGHWATVTLALAVSVWLLPGVQVQSWFVGSFGSEPER